MLNRGLVWNTDWADAAQQNLQNDMCVQSDRGLR